MNDEKVETGQEEKGRVLERGREAEAQERRRRQR